MGVLIFHHHWVYIISVMRFYIIASIFLTIFVVPSKQDEHPYEYQTKEYQTNYDANYNNQDGGQQEVDAIDFLSQQGLKDKQDLFDFGGMDMTTVSMGASMVSAVVALGALAYALTLEARILTNDARSASTCSALYTITNSALTSVPAVTTSDCTVATTGSPTVAEIIACINALRVDVNSNIVTPINAYGNPTC